MKRYLGFTVLLKKCLVRGYNHALHRTVSVCALNPRRVSIAHREARCNTAGERYPLVFHAPRIAARYPTAAIITIGDSGVPLLHGYKGILERWGAGSVLRPFWGGNAPLTLERAYREAAAPPNMEAVASITSDHDAVQSAFYLISGSPSWREQTYGLLDRLEREVPSVRSFVVSGADHGLMRADAFYEYAVGETRLADWVARLVSREPVSSVRCDECSIQ